ncbi:MAG: hypothetical protein P1V97_31220 [Planctomycetota bacterium]|nr:hypothetical protein [Planctomycetota bacterium]
MDKTTDDYGFDQLFARETEDGDLDFLFAPNPELATKEESLKPVLDFGKFDLSAYGAKNHESRDKFYDQGDGDSLYVVVGDTEGVIANIETKAKDTGGGPKRQDLAQRDGWRDLVGSIVFGLLGLWLRRDSRRGSSGE